MSIEQRQSLLNKSVEHVLRQGRPSVATDSGMCVYRGSQGLQCAAGPFIFHYVPEMENKSWTSLVHHYPDHVDTVALQNAAFVNLLQAAHDSASASSSSSLRDSEVLRNAEFMRLYKENIYKLVARERLDLPEQLR